MRAKAVVAAGLVAGAVGGSMAGCAGAGGGDASGPGGKVATGFPEPEQLYELRDRPLDEGSPFGTRFRDVGLWELGGPFPDVAETAPRAGDQPWDALLDDLIAGRAGLAVASRSMECFAREAGRFLIEHEAMPGLGLQRFLAGRCAVVTEAPAFVSLWWEWDRDVTVQSAVAEVGDELADALRRHPVGGPLDVGMWMRADGGRVHVVIVWGQRVARLEPVGTSLAAGQDAVELRGELLHSTAHVEAAVTRGRFGWQMCEPKGEAALPHFHFVCPIDPGDDTTWVSLHYLPSGAILQRAATQLLLRAAGRDAGTYRRHAYTGPRMVASAEEVPEALLELLNEVRAEAGLPPLVEASEQSRVAAEVAPYYFSAIFDPASESIAEMVALGLVAGWEVEDIVQEGLFTFMWLVESRDVASMLSDALEHPGARITLLAPDVERIAIGPLAGEEDEVAYVAAIASTYKLFSEREHRENASLVTGGLTRARAARDRAAPRTLDEVVPLAVSAAARVQAGGVPQEVLGDLIRDSVDTLQRSVVGWVAETQDLGDIQFPEEFLDRRELEVAIAVSVHRPEDEAWGRYVVLMVAAEPQHRRL